MPIIVGIVLIAIYFQARNSNFLTAGNIVNLIVQMASFAVIGMGITWVLLIGEIDLSIGFVSGVGGVIVAKLLLPGGSSIPTALALFLGLGAGLLIGMIQGAIFARIGVPSFVVTLAGLLIWNGVVLLLIGVERHRGHPGQVRQRHRQRLPVRYRGLDRAGGRGGRLRGGADTRHPLAAQGAGCPPTRR